ncbi:cx9C motif-containing protein 4 [Drosophila madeirensis]|uniref:Cx9C motif-containing protein 4 n=1 Tax=Drosophila madeirensis TaxID=30013 RepID=A0AAU9G5C3_DROMD
MSANTKKDPCKANACRIQACLKENNYQENKCADVLEAMRQCCLKWHKVSLCCSGIDLGKPYQTEASKGAGKSEI